MALRSITSGSQDLTERTYMFQMFIEKPISTGTVEDSLELAKTLVDSKTVVSVGYFLRYLRGECK